MHRTVLIAHVKADVDQIENLAAPIREVGYEVTHGGTVLVGESEVEHVERALAAGSPVVLYGTMLAAGSKWVKRIARAARKATGMLFVVQVEEEADLEDLALGEKVAAYWQDPDRAVEDLIAALRKYCPLDADQQQARRVHTAEERYRDLLLETCDIVSLNNLPNPDHIARKQQELKLRGLYIPLRAWIERPPDLDLDPEQVAAYWEALEKRRAAAIRRKGALQQDHGLERAPVGERLARARRLVVLGDPGAGKTTLTRWIATAYLLRLQQDPAWESLPDVGTLPDEDLLPIIIRCRDLDLEHLKGNLDEILLRTLRQTQMDRDEAADLRALLRDRLQQGRALLMLDGLDEIADPRNRAAFCEQIESIVTAFPEAPIIATSRIVGYREMGYRLGRGFEHLTLADLTPDEKDDFIDRWCAFTETPERRATAAEELKRDIHTTERIERLTGNPLLLTTMALVKRTVGKLPSRRADLYFEAVQVLLNWNPPPGNEAPLDWHEAIPQLEYVAYAMCDRGVQSLRHDEILKLIQDMRTAYPNVYDAQKHTPEAFLQRLEAQTGILIEAGHERHLGVLVPVYEFRHLTFQEYLAARALVDGRFPGRNPARPIAEYVVGLAGRTAEEPDDFGVTEVTVVESWREALRLCVTLCRDDDVDAVLIAILTPQEGEDGAVARARAILAALALADEPNASDETAEQVIRTLAAQASGGDGYYLRETSLVMAAHALLGTRWSEMLFAGFVDEFRERPAETREAPGNVVATLKWMQAKQDPFHLSALAALLPTLRRGSEPEVIEASLSIIPAYYEPMAMTVGGAPVGLTTALVDLLSGSPPVAHVAAWALSVPALGWSPSTDQADTLIALISDMASDVGVVSYLIPKLRDEIPKLSDEHVARVRDALLGWIAHPHAHAREAAAYALGQVGGDDARQALLDHFWSDDEPFVRRAAAEALGQVGGDDARQALITCLQSDDELSVRSAAAYALGQVGGDDARQALITCLQSDDNPSVRYAVAYALGRVGGDDARQALITCLQSNDHIEVKRVAAYALRQVGGDDARQALITCLQSDDNPYVRRAAAEALGQVGGDDAHQALISQLRSDDPERRKAALGGLAQQRDETDRRLLSHDLDGHQPFLDSQAPITPAFMDRAASWLHLSSEEIANRYAALAEAFGLRIEAEPTTETFNP